MELKNKNVFITGSSRGIGLAIAHKFASAGANIVLNGRGQNFGRKFWLSLLAIRSRSWLFQATYLMALMLSE